MSWHGASSAAHLSSCTTRRRKNKSGGNLVMDMAFKGESFTKGSTLHSQHAACQRARLPQDCSITTADMCVCHTGSACHQAVQSMHDSGGRMLYVCCMADLHVGTQSEHDVRHQRVHCHTTRPAVPHAKMEHACVCPQHSPAALVCTSMAAQSDVSTGTSSSSSSSPGVTCHESQTCRRPGAHECPRGPPRSQCPAWSGWR